MHFLEKSDLADESPALGKTIEIQPHNPRLPKFVRAYNGIVMNLRLTKVQIESTCSEIWEYRRKEETRKKIPVTLEQAFQGFLFQKMKAEEEAIEYAYNILDGCQRFSWDADLELFLRVIQGVVHHEVREDQSEMVSSLHSLLYDLDETKKGWLPFTRVKRAIGLFFSSKPTHESILIKNCLDKVLPFSNVNLGFGHPPSDHLPNPMVSVQSSWWP